MDWRGDSRFLCAHEIIVASVPEARNKDCDARGSVELALRARSGPSFSIDSKKLPTLASIDMMLLGDSLMRILGVREYDEAERLAIRRSPNRVIEAFQTLAFNRAAYPTRIETESELRRYLDVMHEGRFECFVNQILERLTPWEADLWQKITGVIVDFSERYFRERRVARGSLLQSVNVLRHIRYLYGDARPRVIEFGPGCGYLGSLLLALGYPYAAMDVAQAFYLYQNHFWQFLTKGGIFEGALEAVTSERLSAIAAGTGVHIPWWELGRMRPDNVPQFDIVTCNHALCEMQPSAQRFILALARGFLRGEREAKRFFVFDRWGFSTDELMANLTETFYKNSFVLVHHDPKIVVFAPSDSAYAADHLPLPQLKSELQLSVENGQVAAKQLQSESFFPAQCSSDANPISRAIRQCRAAELPQQVIGVEQMSTIYTAILGRSEHDNEDEEFLRLIDSIGLL